MISNGKALFDIIDDLLSKDGFIKKKDTWYKHSNDCISFFSIGKSPFGGKYDHVFGLFLKELNKTEIDHPLYYKSNFKVHLNDFTDRELVERVFNLENQEFTGNDREHFLSEFFNLYVIPFLNAVSTKEGIKKVIAENPDFIYTMDLDARNLLGLKEPEDD